MIGTKSKQVINSVAGNGLGERCLGQAIEKGYLIGFRGGRIMSQGKGPWKGAVKVAPKVGPCQSGTQL